MSVVYVGPLVTAGVGFVVLVVLYGLDKVAERRERAEMDALEDLHAGAPEVDYDAAIEVPWEKWRGDFV